MRTRMLVITVIATLSACESSEPTLIETDVIRQDPDLAAVQSWAAAAEDVEADAGAVARPTSQPSVAAMLGGLERRLAESPQDVKGWTLLATSYAHVGRMSDARHAKAKAVELGADADALEQQILAAHTGSSR